MSNKWSSWDDFLKLIQSDKKYQNIYDTFTGEALRRRGEKLSSVSTDPNIKAAYNKSFAGSQDLTNSLGGIVSQVGELGYKTDVQATKDGVSIRFSEPGKPSNSYTWKIPVDVNGSLMYNGQNRNNLLFADTDEKGHVQILSTIEMLVKNVQRQLSFEGNKRVLSQHRFDQEGIKRLKWVFGHTTLQTIGGGSALQPYNAKALADEHKALSIKSSDSDYKVDTQKATVSFKYLFDDMVRQATKNQGSFQQQNIKQAELSRLFQKGLLLCNTHGVAKGLSQLYNEPLYKELLKTETGQRLALTAAQTLKDLSGLNLQVGPVAEEKGLEQAFFHDVQRAYNHLKPQKDRKLKQTQSVNQNFINKGRSSARLHGSGTLVTTPYALNTFGNKLQSKKYDQTRMIGINDSILAEARKIEKETLEQEFKKKEAALTAKLGDPTANLTQKQFDAQIAALKKSQEEQIKKHQLYSVQNGGMLISDKRAAELNSYVDVVKKIENRAINEEFNKLLTKKNIDLTGVDPSKRRETLQQTLSDSEIDQLVRDALTNAMKRTNSKDFDTTKDLLSYGSKAAHIDFEKDSAQLRKQKSLEAFVKDFVKNNYSLNTDNSGETDTSTRFTIRKKGLIKNIQPEIKKYVTPSGTMRMVGEMIDPEFQKYLFKAINKTNPGVDLSGVEAFFEDTGYKSKNVLDLAVGVTNDLIAKTISKHKNQKHLTSGVANEFLNNLIGTNGQIKDSDLQSMLKNMFNYKSYNGKDDRGGGVFTTSTDVNDQKLFNKSLPALLYAYGSMDRQLDGGTGQSIFASIRHGKDGDNLLGNAIKSADDLWSIIKSPEGADLIYEFLPKAISEELALHDSALYGSASSKGGAPLSYGYREIDSLSRMAAMGNNGKGLSNLSNYAKQLKSSAELTPEYYAGIQHFGEFANKHGFKNIQLENSTKDRLSGEIFTTVNLDELSKVDELSSEEIENARSGSSFLSSMIDPASGDPRTYVEYLNRERLKKYDTLSDKDKEILLNKAGGSAQVEKMLSDADLPENPTEQDIQSVRDNITRNLASSMIHVGLRGMPLIGQLSNGSAKTESTTAFLPYFAKTSYRDGEETLTNYTMFEQIESFIRDLKYAYDNDYAADAHGTSLKYGERYANLLAQSQELVDQKDGSIFARANKISMPHSTQSLNVATSDLTGTSLDSDQIEDILSDAIVLSPNEYKKMLQPTAEDKKLIEKGSLQWSSVLYERYKSMYGQIVDESYSDFAKNFKKDKKSSSKEKSMISYLTNKLVKGAEIGSAAWKKTGRRGDVGFLNRFPSITGMDTQAVKIFTNAKWKGQDNRIGLGRFLADLINGDVDGDMINAVLSGMDYRQSGVKEQAGVLSDSRSLTTVTKNLTKWMKSIHPHANNETSTLAQKELDELNDEDAQAAGAFASKFNKAFTGPYSNIRQRFHQGMNLSNKKLDMNNPDADFLTWASQIFENFLSIPEQTGISSKKANFKTNLNGALDVFTALRDNKHFSRKDMPLLIQKMQSVGMLNDDEDVSTLGLFSDDAAQERNLPFIFDALENQAKSLQQRINDGKLDQESADKIFGRYMGAFGSTDLFKLNDFVSQSQTTNGRKNIIDTLRPRINTDFFANIVGDLNDNNLLQQGSIPGANYINSDTVLRKVLFDGRERYFTDDEISRLKGIDADFVRTEDGFVGGWNPKRQSANPTGLSYVTSLVKNSIPTQSDNIAPLWKDPNDSFKYKTLEDIKTSYNSPALSSKDREAQRRMFLHTETGTLAHDITQAIVTDPEAIGKLFEDGELKGGVDFSGIKSQSDFDARLAEWGITPTTSEAESLGGKIGKFQKDYFDRASAMGYSADDLWSKPEFVSKITQGLANVFLTLSSTESQDELSKRQFDVNKHKHDIRLAEAGLVSEEGPADRRRNIGAFLDMMILTKKSVKDYDKRSFAQRKSRAIAELSGDHATQLESIKDEAGLDKLLQEIIDKGQPEDADSAVAQSILDQKSALKEVYTLVHGDYKTGTGGVSAKDAAQVAMNDKLIKDSRLIFQHAFGNDRIQELRNQLDIVRSSTDEETIKNAQQAADQLVKNFTDELDKGSEDANVAKTIDKKALAQWKKLKLITQKNTDPEYKQQLATMLLASERQESNVYKSGHVFTGDFRESQDLINAVANGDTITDDIQQKAINSFVGDKYYGVRLPDNINEADAQKINTFISQILGQNAKIAKLKDKNGLVDQSSAESISYQNQIGAATDKVTSLKQQFKELVQTMGDSNEDSNSKLSPFLAPYGIKTIDELDDVAAKEYEKSAWFSSDRIKEYEKNTGELQKNLSAIHANELAINKAQADVNHNNSDIIQNYAYQNELLKNANKKIQDRNKEIEKHWFKDNSQLAQAFQGSSLGAVGNAKIQTAASKNTQANIDSENYSKTLQSQLPMERRLNVLEENLKRRDLSTVERKRYRQERDEVSQQLAILRSESSGLEESYHLSSKDNRFHGRYSKGFNKARRKYGEAKSQWMDPKLESQDDIYAQRIREQSNATSVYANLNSTLLALEMNKLKSAESTNAVEQKLLKIEQDNLLTKKKYAEIQIEKLETSKSMSPEALEKSKTAADAQFAAQQQASESAALNEKWQKSNSSRALYQKNSDLKFKIWSNRERYKETTSVSEQKHLNIEFEGLKSNLQETSEQLKLLIKHEGKNDKFAKDANALLAYRKEEFSKGGVQRQHSEQSAAYDVYNRESDLQYNKWLNDRKLGKAKTESERAYLKENSKRIQGDLDAASDARKKYEQDHGGTNTSAQNFANARLEYQKEKYVQGNDKGGLAGAFKRSLGMSLRRLSFNFGLTAMIMKLMRTMKQLAGEAKALDKVMTNLRIVTGDTKSDTQNLINDYAQLAKNLGVTTKEVAASATEWLRQGYETNEAIDLVTSSLYLSKLGMIDSASATKNLTSALKGFKIQASESMDVVDKLTALDLKAATSAGEIAEGLAKFANLGSLAGVGIDEAAAYVATISDVTQMSGSSAGQALKTIISRYGNVKAGAYGRMNVSAEGADQTESINDVEKVLNKLGINIRDTALNFRDFDDVLSDIAQRWVSLDKVSQKAIANAFAGVRQQEAFVTLMQNWDKYEDLLSVSKNSEGTAEKKYTAYQDSYEAAKNELTASIEKMVNNSELTSILTELVKMLTGIANTLPGILKGLTNMFLLVEVFRAFKGKSLLQKGLNKVSDSGFFSNFKLTDKEKRGKGFFKRTMLSARKGMSHVLYGDAGEKMFKDHLKKSQKKNKAATDKNTKAKKKNTQATNQDTQSTNKKTKSTKKNTRANRKNSSATNKDTKSRNKNTKSNKKNTKATDKNTKAKRKNTGATNSNTRSTKKNGKGGGIGGKGGKGGQSLGKGAAKQGATAALTYAAASAASMLTTYMTAGETHTNREGEEVASSDKAKKAGKAISTSLAAIPMVGPMIDELFHISDKAMADIDRARDEAVIATKKAQRDLEVIKEGKTSLSTMNRLKDSTSRENILEREEAAKKFGDKLFLSENSGLKKSLNKDLANIAEKLDWTNSQLGEEIKLSTNVDDLLNDYTSNDSEKRDRAVKLLEIATMKAEHDRIRASRASEMQKRSDKLGQSYLEYRKNNQNLQLDENGKAKISTSGLAMRQGEKYNENGLTAGEQSGATGRGWGKGLGVGALVGAGTLGAGLAGAAITGAATTIGAAAAVSAAVPVVGAIAAGVMILGTLIGGAIWTSVETQRAQKEAEDAWNRKSLNEQKKEIQLQQDAKLDRVKELEHQDELFDKLDSTQFTNEDIDNLVKEGKISQEEANKIKNSEDLTDEEEQNLKDLKIDRLKEEENLSKEDLEILQNSEELTDGQKKELEELRTQTAQGEETLRAYNEQLAYLKAIADENNRFKVEEAMASAYTETGSGKKQFISDMNVSQLDAMGMNNVYEAIANEVLRNGGLERGRVYSYKDASGNFASGRMMQLFEMLDSGQIKAEDIDHLVAAKKISQEDADMLRQRDSYKREFSSEFLDYADSMTNKDQEIYAAKTGKNTTIAGAIHRYNEHPDDKYRRDILENFAKALNMSVDELIANADVLEERYSELKLSDLTASTADLIQEEDKYNTLLHEITDGTASASKWMSTITSQFPDLIQYMGNVPELVDHVMKKMKQLADQQVKSQWNDYASSSAAFDDQEGGGFKGQILNSVEGEERARLEKIITDSGATTLDELVKYATSISSTSNADKTGDYDILMKGLEAAGSDITLTSDIYLDSLREYTEFKASELDKEINQLNDQKAALQDINHQREYELKLIQAKMDLESAAENKKRVYRAGIGFVYEADQGELAEKQKKLEEVENEKDISEIDEAIALLQDQKAEWTNIWEKKTYELEVLRNKAFEKEFGLIQDGQTEGAKATENVGKAIDNVYTVMDKVSSMISGKDSSSVSLSQETLDKINSRNSQKAQKIKALNDAWENYQNVKKNSPNDTEAIKNAHDAYVKAHEEAAPYLSNEDYKNNKDDSGKTINSGLSSEAKEALGAEGEPDPVQDYAALKIEGNYYKMLKEAKGDLSVDDNNYIMKDIFDGKHQSAYIWSAKDAATGGSKINEKGQAAGYPQISEKEDLHSYAQRLNEYGIHEAFIGGLDNDNEFAYLKDGHAYAASAPEPIDKSKLGNDEGRWDFRAARGTLKLGTPGMSYNPSANNNNKYKHKHKTLINEYGTEAIITPEGTITALPSRTGIVPADITRNLWSLGAVAPQILSALDGGFNNHNYDRFLHSSSVNNDDSLRINHFIMNVDADSSFDLDELVQSIRSRVALTRHSKF